MRSDEATRLDFQVGRDISILERSAFAWFGERLKPLGIGPGEQAYLLSLFPGEEVSQETLTRRMAVDKANVSRALARLERRGLVERRRACGDGREKGTRLTAAGVERRAEVESIAAAWIETLREGISGAEWDSLASLIGKMARNARGAS